MTGDPLLTWLCVGAQRDDTKAAYARASRIAWGLAINARDPMQESELATASLALARIASRKPPDARRRVRLVPGLIARLKRRSLLLACLAALGAGIPAAAPAHGAEPTVLRTDLPQVAVPFPALKPPILKFPEPELVKAPLPKWLAYAECFESKTETEFSGCAMLIDSREAVR
jgi:hypothetical protein